MASEGETPQPYANGGADPAPKKELKKQASGHLETVINTAKSVQANCLEAWKVLRPYYDAALPYLEVAKPYAKKAYLLLLEVWSFFQTKVLPYCDKEVNQIIFAVVLLFFGGNFAMTVACVQAFRQVGWRSMQVSFDQLKESFEEAVETLDKDEDAKKVFGLDDDKELEIMEVFRVLKQMALADSPSEKDGARAKMFILMRCIDPNKILDASKGLWVGIVAVISTLRSRIAYCVSLGASIGHSICEFGKKYVQQFLYDAFPDQKKWVDFGLRSGSGLIGIIISLFLTRVVCAFYSALQGAALLTKVIFMYLRRQERLEKGRRSSIGKVLFETPTLGDSFKKLSKQEEAVQWGLILAGLLFQYWTRYHMPFLLWLPLAPLYMVENMLSVLAVV